MFNDIGPLELVTIVVIAVLVFGPDKLPKLIQDFSRFVRKIRDFSDSAKEDIRTELGPEFKDFEFEDLNPKAYLRKQMENDDLGIKELRSSFDLRKEINEVADAVNGTEGAAKATGAAAAGAAAAGAGSVDMVKKPTANLAKPDAPATPAFDPDAT